MSPFPAPLKVALCSRVAQPPGTCGGGAGSGALTPAGAEVDIQGATAVGTLSKASSHPAGRLPLPLYLFRSLPSAAALCRSVTPESSSSPPKVPEAGRIPRDPPAVSLQPEVARRTERETPAAEARRRAPGGGRGGRAPRYFPEGRRAGRQPGRGRPRPGLPRSGRRAPSAPPGAKFLRELPAGPRPPGPAPARGAAAAAAMPAPCARGPAAGDGRLRLARLALVLLGWVSSCPPAASAAPASAAAPFPASAASAPPPLPSRCPAPCECSEAARTVKCVNRNLSAVPADLPAYTRTLFLTGNQLAVLPAGAFARRPPLAELAALNLSGSRLARVHAAAFEDLPSLRQLDLSHNPLVHLSPFAFSGLNASASAPSPLSELILNHIEPPAEHLDPEQKQNQSVESMVAAALRAGRALQGLRRLELASNHLLYLPRDTLAQLPGLRHLDLRNNSLVSLTYLSFRNLTHLERLHLEDNALKVLHNGTLAELQGLERVKVFLDNNPWVCDCHMVDMVTWLKETEIVEGKAGLTCAFPEKMRNHILVELNISDLDCDPILPPSLQTSYVFLGIVLALIGAIFLLVLYLNRKGIKKWMHNIRDACRDHMEGYHYRYEINADPRLTNLSSNSDV
ncbi:PREDICTED: trophoblast glycoprotein [Chinchilla lanigera]|uniref:trophoblast glycoprotein n=1 Tax=Chinchilla lanigera TaxID=34839 RepID=UPI0006978B13|nr:PREDICTED: trophoblast glycoprotein [Chinchilla lanigera]